MSTRLTTHERQLLADRVLGGAEPSSLMVRAVEQIIADRIAAEREWIAIAIEAHAKARLPLWLQSNYESAARIARDGADGEADHV